MWWTVRRRVQRDSGFPLLLSGRRPVIYERHVSRMIQTEGNAPSVFMKWNLPPCVSWGALCPLRGACFRKQGRNGICAMWRSFPTLFPFIRPFRLPERKSGVIAVGKISPQKNYGALLEAWKRVHGNFRTGGWTCSARSATEQAENGDSGGGAGRKLRAASAHEGNHGGVPGASICAMSSKYEGFGMMMVEAMAWRAVRGL